MATLTETEKYMIDIDTGGTFTDGFFSQGDRFEIVKVDTTPHDLTICFNNCIAEGAKLFGYNDIDSFLEQTKTIRLSTTIGTNSLIQKTGPKIGLIVSKGYQSTLYQENDNPILNYIVDPENVVEINEEVSEDGQVLQPVNAEEVKRATKELLELGTRVIVVSLKNAHLNNQNEREVRKVIQQDYPKHYLGTKPIQLGSEISSRSNDGIRTNAAVVNAYLHRDMVNYLYKADESMRLQGYNRPLLIAHANGGVARVAKTKALDTYNSGPAAGLMGSKYIGSLYGLDNILTVDVGGTSTDIGLISNGELTFDTESSISNIPVHTPLIHVLSVGGGGGSIAKVPREGELQLGPESAGAVPGPACFDLGNTKPAVTDAAVVLGLIDPDYFLGGTKKISKDKAEAAVRKWIAEPLDISIEEAAARIIDRLEQIGANTLKQLATERGKNVSDFELFLFGGGGGLFAARMAQKSGISKVYTFPFGSVFSAFGLSTADVAHTYQERLDFQYKKNDMDLSQMTDKAKDLIEAMKKLSFRDMRGEGFSQDSIEFEVSVEVATSDGSRREIIALPLQILTNDNHPELENALNGIANRLQTDEVNVEFLRLSSNVSVSRFALPKLSLTNEKPDIKSTREIYWTDRYIETNIYELESLKPGHEITGPAVLEGLSTSVVVPPGCHFRIDEHLNGIMEV